MIPKATANDLELAARDVIYEAQDGADWNVYEEDEEATEDGIPARLFGFKRLKSLESAVEGSHPQETIDRQEESDQGWPEINSRGSRKEHQASCGDKAKIEEEMKAAAGLSYIFVASSSNVSQTTEITSGRPARAHSGSHPHGHCSPLHMATRTPASIQRFSGPGSGLVLVGDVRMPTCTNFFASSPAQP